MHPRVEDLVFDRAFSPEREKKGAESASSWRPRCGRRLREEAPSHTASGRAPSNKTLSGHLRSRPSVRSVTNFPVFLPRRLGGHLSSARPLARRYVPRRAHVPLLHPKRPTGNQILEEDSAKDATSIGLLIFVLIKRGRVSTWRKLISARHYAATTSRNGGRWGANGG